MFGYQTCADQAGVVNTSFGTFPLNALLRTLESCKIEEKHIGTFVSNSVEMQLLHDSENLVCMQRKLVSYVVDLMQTNLSRGNSYLENYLKNLMTQYPL